MENKIEESRLSREEAFFDKLADEQSDSWWGHKTASGKERQKRRAQIVANYLEPLNESSKVLEIGCGGGDFTVYLLEELTKCDYLGVDISDGLLDIARRRITHGWVKFLKGDVENLRPDLGEFDFVIGQSILHHLDIHKTFSSMQSVLKPGGKILFLEPNMKNPQIWLEKNVRFIGALTQNTEDETAFYKSRMERDMLTAGFSSVSVEPFDFLHPLIPGFLYGAFSKLNDALETTPIIKNYAGSLLIKGSR